MRKIEVSTGTLTEFEFRDAAADIQEGGKGDKREGERGPETEGGSQKGGNCTPSRAVSGKKSMRGQTEVTQKWTPRVEDRQHISVALKPQEGAHNMYLMDSDGEAIVDFVKDHKELHRKLN